MKSIASIHVLVLLVTISSCGQKAEPEIYLVQSNFAGKANILFNKKEGAPEKFEDNRRVYDIPSDGILLTQFKSNDGVIDRKYYSVDSNGKRIQLKAFKYEHEKDGSIKWIISDSSEIGVFFDGTSGQYGNNGDSKASQYQEFIVTSYNKLDSFQSKSYRDYFERKIESVTGLKLQLH